MIVFSPTFATIEIALTTRIVSTYISASSMKIAGGN